jgi:hypothetical protein
MKKSVLITLGLITLLVTSCTPDYTNLNILQGTTWRCGDFLNSTTYSIMEYKEFRFLSTDSVEEWNKIKRNSPKKRQTMFYSLKNDTITLFIKNADPILPLAKIVINGRYLNYTYRGYNFTFTRYKKYIIK